MSEVAIVDTVGVNEVARSIARALVVYHDGERALQAAETKTAGLREQQAQRRLYIGRMLFEAKRDVPRGGWEPFIAKLGVSSQRASEWMRLVGFVESTKSPTSENAGDLDTPTLRDAGIDKRPRKRDEQPDPPPRLERREAEASEEQDGDDSDDAPTLHASWRHDLSKALVGLDKMIMGYAKSWPKRSRSDLARALRSVAERIERMAGE